VFLLVVALHLFARITAAAASISRCVIALSLMLAARVTTAAGVRTGCILVLHARVSAVSAFPGTFLSVVLCCITLTTRIAAATLLGDLAI